MSYERGLVTQLPIETIVVLVGKSNPAFDLQADSIFGYNGGDKENKFLDYIRSIVIGRNLGIKTSLFVDNKYFVFPSFTARLILVDYRSIALKSAVTSRLVRPMMSMSAAY